MNLLYSKDKNKNDNYKDTIVELIKKRKNFLFRDLKKNNVKSTNSVNIYYFDNHQSAREFMSTTPETLGSTPLYFTPSKNGIHDGKKSITLIQSMMRLRILQETLINIWEENLIA